MTIKKYQEEFCESLLLNSHECYFMNVYVNVHSVTFCFHKIENHDKIFLKVCTGGNTHKHSKNLGTQLF